MKIDIVKWTPCDSQITDLKEGESYATTHRDFFYKERAAIWEKIWGMANQLALIKQGAPEFTETRPWLRNVFTIDIANGSFSTKGIVGLTKGLSEPYLSPAIADMVIANFNLLLKDFQQFYAEKSVLRWEENKLTDILHGVVSKLSKAELVILKKWFTLCDQDSPEVINRRLCLNDFTEEQLDIIFGRN